MAATTTTCQVCNDKGIIYTELWAGVFKTSLCGCQPPEYWNERSKRRMAELSTRIAEMERIYGGEEIGEAEICGRQTN